MRKLMISLAATALIGAQDTVAQSLLTTEPLTSPAAAYRPLAESLILSTRPIAVATAAARPEIGLTAFEQSKSALRLEGEDDVINLTFLLDATMLAAGGELVIAYRNAVSVMPETSMISVLVNGTPAGEFAIRSPSGFEKQVLSLSPALLRAGLNDVRVRAVQRHRVDCSMEATYELWSEIDQQSSGFRSAATDRPVNFASLRGLGRNDQGLTELRLILPKGAGVEALNRSTGLIQTMSLALNRDDISVSVADSAGSGPGIDLVVATDDNPVSLDNLPVEAPYGLSIVAGADPRRARVMLRAATGGEIPGLLLAAVEGPLKPLLDSGVRAIRKGEIRAEASKVYTLADAGYVAAPFSGRLFRTRFEMVMPADFYPAEYATMDLALHAATSPGLKPTSQLLVRVNDQIVKSLPMRDTGGEVFSGRRLELPLRAFRPGRNQVELLAELERTADDRCVFSERDVTTPRFILLDTTEIRVPALARVARLPELAAMAGSGYPYSGSAGVDVHTLKSDSGSVSAALTIIGKISLAAQAPVRTRLAFGPPDTDASGNALIIAPQRAVEDLARLGPAGFPAVPEQIEFARNGEIADPITTASINLPGAAVPVAVTTDPAALLDAFRQTTRKFGPGPSTFGSLSDRMGEAYRSFRHWLNYEPTSNPAALVEPRRKAVLTQRPSVSGAGVVTWLTADTQLDIVEASGLLADPAVWNRLAGETVILDLQARTMRTVRPESYFTVEIKDFGPGNLRRVAAGWFSDHFRFYVALVIALMAVFAIWLGRAVPRAGVRTDR